MDRLGEEKRTGSRFQSNLLLASKERTEPDPEPSDKAIRQFWIDHCIASRKISEYMGEQLNSPAIMNIWIPDGYKDIPADRLAPRERLIGALDEVLASTGSASGAKHHKVAVEGKLFGIGAESYTVGTNEFYMAYAATRKTLLCIDAGHFHPTENVADKISTSLCFLDEILLHVSRPVRWDSDHVVLFDDATIAIAQEIVRCNGLERVHVGLDYFDASINRVAAWVIGSRNFRKALLFALLEPHQALIEAESRFDFTTRLALMEEAKSLPWPAVWDYYCVTRNVPCGGEWLQAVVSMKPTCSAEECEKKTAGMDGTSVPPKRMKMRVDSTSLRDCGFWCSPTRGFVAAATPPWAIVGAPSGSFENWRLRLKQFSGQIPAAAGRLRPTIPKLKRTFGAPCAQNDT